MRREGLLRLSALSAIWGSAGYVGNLETDMSLIVPTVIMLIGIVGLLVWKVMDFKSDLDEARENNRIDRKRNDSRPKYLQW